MFINLHASSLASKWRGESEKLVRTAFELARHNAPSVMFIDEIDALLGDRGAVGEHESSRRYHLFLKSLRKPVSKDMTTMEYIRTEICSIYVVLEY